MRVQPNPSPSPVPSNSFPPGSTVAGRVLSREGDSAVAMIGSRRVSLRFEGAVPASGPFRATVLKADASGLVVRIVRDSRPEAPQSSGRGAVLARSLPDPVTHAFLRSSLPLAQDRTDVVRRLVRGESESEQRGKARLYAILEEKGLLLSESVRGALRRVLFGSDNTSDDDHRDREDPSDSSQKGHAGEAEPQSPPSAPEHDEVALFNHSRGASGQWVVLPIASDLFPDATIALAVQFRSPGPVKWNGATDHAFLHVSRGDERLVFRVAGIDGTLSVEQIQGRAIDPDPELEAAFLRMNIGFNPRAVSSDSNDGFSDTDGPVIIGPLDERA